MATNRTSVDLGLLLQAAGAGEAEGKTDGQLLEQFLARRDEAAFAALVRRHGPMVLGVCRRILGHAADADDAFQAAFLVLVRKAASLTARRVLGDWLHGVARHTALKARSAAARRRAKEQAMARPEAQGEGARDDWLPLLDEELGRLAEKYRLPIVLCDLEGRTRREAAERLRWPEGTVAGRLARGRALLAKRLARHGLALSAGALSAALAQKAAPASVPPLLLASTVRAATLVAAGPAASGVIPAQVAGLTEGVVRAMLLSKLRTTAVVALAAVLGAAAITCAVLAGGQGDSRTAGTDKPGPAGRAEEPPKRNDGKSDGEDDRSKLRGTWRVVSVESDGLRLGEGRPEIEGGKAVIDGTTLTLVEKGVRRALEFRLDPAKDPKEIRLTTEKNELLRGIYEVEGDGFRLCFVKDGEGKAPAAFTAEAGSKRWLFTFRRDRPAKDDRPKDPGAGKPKGKQLSLVAETDSWQGKPYVKVSVVNPTSARLELSDHYVPAFDISVLCTVKVDGNEAMILSSGDFILRAGQKELPPDSKTLLGLLTFDDKVARHFGGYTPVVYFKRNGSLVPLGPGKHTLEIGTKGTNFPTPVTPTTIEVDLGHGQ